MTRRLSLRALIPLGAAIAPLLVAPAAGAGATDQANAYGISLFGGTNECGTKSMSHSAHVKSATAFTDEFPPYESLALWGSYVDVYDTAASSDYFTDPTKANTCNCSFENDNHPVAGIDTAAVAYMHTHGKHSVANNDSTFSMGNSGSGYVCSLGTDTSILFGNSSASGKLEIATFKACEGADFTVFKQGGYRKMINSTSKFQLYNAFHGVSSCGNFVADYVGDFASDSFFDGVGENWIDEAYDDNGQSGTDDCPTTIVFGSSKSSRKNMFYNGGFVDRKLTGATKSGSTYFFVAGCFPTNGVQLPQ